jgi:hypothetical protein
VAVTRSERRNQQVGNRYVHCTLSSLSLNGFDELRPTLPHELINRGGWRGRICFLNAASFGSAHLCRYSSCTRVS